MYVQSYMYRDIKEIKASKKLENPYQEIKILCSHCNRTKDNGISCIGKCVADNDY